MIRVITRGDDAGSARAANRAIHDCCTKGVLRNVSLMACTPEIEHAAQLLLPLKDVCFGMHATVTCEWAWPKWGTVADAEKVAPLLAPDQAMYPTPLEIHEKKVAPEIIMIEMQAQLERLRKLRFDVRYVDQHMGFGWLDGLDALMLEWVASEGLIFQPKVDRLEVEGDFLDQADRMVAMLEAGPEGTYLKVAHPCYVDAESMKIVKTGGREGETAIDRDGQRRIFMDERVVSMFEERDDLVAIRYDEI